VTGGGNLSTSATSIYAGSGSPQGYPTSYPWILRLEPGTSNEELVLVASGAGTVASPWIVSRAQDGTTAKTHAAGVYIAHGMSAFDLTTAATHYQQGSGSGVHGLPATAWLAGSFATVSEQLTTAAQATVSFSGIPATGAHLLLVATGRLAETSVQSDDVTLQFNGDSGAHYAYLTDLLNNAGGSMTGPASGTGYAGTSAPIFRFLASSSGAAVNAGGGFAIIPNYTGTAYNKIFYSLSGGGNGTTSFVDMRTRMGIWNPAAQAAITAITLTAPTGGFDANCQFSLYTFG
jgi:hypothetical protein